MQMLQRNFLQPRPVLILTTSSSKTRFNIIPNYYFNICTVHLLLFCTMTNSCAFVGHSTK
jgi:hypothetical protein